MNRRPLTVAAALVCSTLLAVPALPASAGGGTPPTELMGDGPTPIPLKNQAMISKSDWGLRYRAGQQHSHLTVTIEGDRVRYVDTGTEKWRVKGRAMPRSCTRLKVDTGVAASCRIPAAYRNGETMFLEIWPRLGNDWVDGSTLPANIRFWVLGDEGHDTIFSGAGDDFSNGAQDDDELHGGAGDDWLRGGANEDDVYGDAGQDYLTAIDGVDRMWGGPDADKIYGGDQADQLWGGSGADTVNCGNGPDEAAVEGADTVRDCEKTSADTY